LSVSHETMFFGNLVSLNCYVKDLLLILDKTENIELSGTSDDFIFDSFFARKTGYKPSFRAV